MPRWPITSAVAFLVLLAGCQRQLMPTPNLYVNSPGDPFEEVPEALRTPDVSLVYVTDRAPLEQPDGSTAYGTARSRSVAVGECVVQVGQDLTWESLVENSRTDQRSLSIPLRMKSVDEVCRFPETPIPFKLVDGRVVDDPEVVAEREVAAEAARELLRERLALTPRKDLFLFVHGFNNSFDDAAFRLAELWHFLGREGVPVLYSWPAGSGGFLVKAYSHDRESGEFTIYHLKNTLRFLASIDEVEDIHIVSHSRGTDVVTSALRELLIEQTAAGRDPREALKVGTLVLAAPDLDMEVVRQRLGSERFFRLIDQGTIYVNNRDKALGAAADLFGSQSRVGNLDIESLPEESRRILEASGRIYLIDSNVRTGFLGHAYFLESPAVSSDLILTLRKERRPGVDHGRPLLERAPFFYRIVDSYPGEMKFGVGRAPVD